MQAKVQKLKNYLGSSPELASSLRGGARAANYNATPITDGIVAWEMFTIYL